MLIQASSGRKVYIGMVSDSGCPEHPKSCKPSLGFPFCRNSYAIAGSWPLSLAKDLGLSLGLSLGFEVYRCLLGSNWHSSSLHS